MARKRISLEDIIEDLKKEINSGIWYVYVVECKDGTLYTGTTNNVERRVKQHNEGKGARYTKYRAPVVLKASWEYGNRSEATKAEYKFKQLTKEKKLKAINQ